MKLPHTRFVVYQIVVGLPDEEIGWLLLMDSLVVPDEAEFARLQFEIADRPQPFRPFDPEDRASVDWLRAQRLLGLLRGSAESREALRILRSPVIRHPIEMLLLGGHRVFTVKRFLEERHLPKVSEDGITTFGNYCWNVPSLDVGEWTLFLERYSMGPVYKELLSADPDKVIEIADAFMARMKRQFMVTSTLRGQGPLLTPGTSDSSLRNLLTDAKNATY